MLQISCGQNECIQNAKIEVQRSKIISPTTTVQTTNPQEHQESLIKFVGSKQSQFKNKLTPIAVQVKVNRVGQKTVYAFKGGLKKDDSSANFSKKKQTFYSPALLMSDSFFAFNVEEISQIS